jgi:hypothetical protein
MVRRVAYLAAVTGLGLALAGCGFSSFFGGEQRAAWRDQEERACMASRPPVVFSQYVETERETDGRGACGVLMPLKVSAFGDGQVRVSPSALMGCPMTTMLEDWLRDSVQPAAMAWYGSPVVGIKQLSNYACRSKNNIPGESLSEHAFGNAIDIAAFTFADGRTVTVERGWKGAEEERGFLREVEASACITFKTTLGPGYPYHGNHFHLDLAHHGKDPTSRYCNPKPTTEIALHAPVRGPFTRSNIDWMRTGSVSKAGGTMLDAAPEDVLREQRDPFGAYKFDSRIAAPAYAGD